MIELRNEKLKADPSQGSHFFQNITSLGIHYITVTEGSDDYFDWEWVGSRPAIQETTYLRHFEIDKEQRSGRKGISSGCGRGA